MITMRVTIDDKALRKQLAKDQKFLKNLPQEAYNYFVAQTPVKTGNARRSTDLRGNTIVADYAYAQRLDTGWSKQAPKGMTQPTERFIDREINKKIGK
jgi:expansin (peptidoglycan-binding protein)